MKKSWTITLGMDNHVIVGDIDGENRTQNTVSELRRFPIMRENLIGYFSIDVEDSHEYEHGDEMPIIYRISWRDGARLAFTWGNACALAEQTKQVDPTARIEAFDGYSWYSVDDNGNIIL